MSNGSKVLIYLSLYLSASIVDSNPQGLISSNTKISCHNSLILIFIVLISSVISLKKVAYGKKTKIVLLRSLQEMPNFFVLFTGTGDPPLVVV